MTIPLPTTSTEVRLPPPTSLEQSIQAMNEMMDRESRLAYSEYMEAKAKKIVSPDAAMRRKTAPHPKENEEEDVYPKMKRHCIH